MNNYIKHKTKVNLRFCNNYRKLNNHIVTARQIKLEGSIGKVIANYPLPTIDNPLARFQGCKYFSTMDLMSGCYHIQLSKKAAEKTTFIIDKGKWVFHLLPFVINIGQSTFSYILGKVLSSCHKFTISYLDDIIFFPDLAAASSTFRRCF